eukprot:COSAG02_NODE_2791_length_8022_cov_5.437208_6_plen_96_part_00
MFAPTCAEMQRTHMIALRREERREATANLTIRYHQHFLPVLIHEVSLAVNCQCPWPSQGMIYTDLCRSRQQFLAPGASVIRLARDKSVCCVPGQW